MRRGSRAGSGGLVSGAPNLKSVSVIVEKPSIENFAHAERPLSKLGTAVALAKGFNSLGAESLAVTWKIAETVGLAPRLDDYEVAGYGILSPTTFFAVERIAEGRLLEGYKPGAQNEEQLVKFGRLLRQYERADIDRLARYLIAPGEIYEGNVPEAKALLSRVRKASAHLIG